MGSTTGIAWTDATWNPVTGCSKVSEGCRNCYAEALSLRRGWSRLPWTHPNARENVVLHPDRLGLPTRWRDPRMVFVNSMSDLFHELVPFDFVDRVFEVMAAARRHRFQILTKRPERLFEWLRSTTYLGVGDFLGNVWLGVSIEDQANFGRALSLLGVTQLARWPVRFVSAEPLLGHVDLSPVLGPWGINWVIAGGESGPNCRPMREEWARSLRDQCAAAGVPYFFKQWGGHPNARSHGQAVLDGRTWTETPA